MYVLYTVQFYIYCTYCHWNLLFFGDIGDFLEVFLGSKSQLQAFGIGFMEKNLQKKSFYRSKKIVSKCLNHHKVKIYIQRPEKNLSHEIFPLNGRGCSRLLNRTFRNFHQKLKVEKLNSHNLPAQRALTSSLPPMEFFELKSQVFILDIF